MAKKKKKFSITKEQEALFNPEYLEKFKEKKEESNISGNGYSALNAAFERDGCFLKKYRNNTLR